MGMDEGNYGGENGGKHEDPDWNWMCTDGTYGAWTRGIGLVRSMETVIICMPEPQVLVTKVTTITEGDAR